MVRVRYLLFLTLAHCAQGLTVAQQEEPLAAVTCTVSSFDYPVSPSQWGDVYQNRGFYTDGNHLGRDVNLIEGTPIHPIACGTIQIYRPASGYGTLAVVIEHRLPAPLRVTNGLGQAVMVRSFLSIYGHIRPTTLRRGTTRLPWRVGDTVRPTDTIGYVEHANDNGDGAEHLHLGIRLQSAADAQRADPRAWFRGYDTNPSQRGAYADPLIFLPRLMADVEEEDDTEGAGTPLPPPDASVPFVPDVVPMPTPDASAPPPPDVMPRPPSPPVDASVPMPPPSMTSGGVRYEFRVQGGGWNAAEPFKLRDLWWVSQSCQNTGTTTMQPMGDGWYRCDLPGRLSPFVGSFFDPFHTDWGDRGHIGTIGNSPERCTPTSGVTWRITDLSTGLRLYEGPASGLPCEAVGSQDRHRLP